MILIYRLLINLVLVFSPLIVLIRLIKKKEHFTRFKEKFTLFSKKRNKGKLVWFHGASVGELKSDEFNHLVISSRCAECVKNFYRGANLLENTNTCD